MPQAPRNDKSLRLSSKLRAPGTRADCTTIPVGQLVGVNSTELKAMLSEAAHAVLESRPSTQQVCCLSLMFIGMHSKIQLRLYCIAVSSHGVSHVACCMLHLALCFRICSHARAVHQAALDHASSGEQASISAHDRKPCWQQPSTAHASCLFLGGLQVARKHSHSDDPKPSSTDFQNYLLANHNFSCCACRWARSAPQASPQQIGLRSAPSPEPC